MKMSWQYQDIKKNEDTQKEWMVTIKIKDTYTNGVPQSRMKTEDAENTMICFNH